MKIYKQFFNEELLKELWECAHSTSYSKIQDDIYNFRGTDITGELKSKVEQAFNTHGYLEEIGILRIQRIDAGFRVAENFHTHRQYYTTNIVCFLNDDYTGGEFEYIEDSTELVKPVTNTACIFPPEIPHRVLPVESGKRYTLVAFLKGSSYIKKQETLI